MSSAKSSMLMQVFGAKAGCRVSDLALFAAELLMSPDVTVSIHFEQPSAVETVHTALLELVSLWQSSLHCADSSNPSNVAQGTGLNCDIWYRKWKQQREHISALALQVRRDWGLKSPAGSLDWQHVMKEYLKQDRQAALKMSAGTRSIVILADCSAPTSGCDDDQGKHASTVILSDPPEIP